MFFKTALLSAFVGLASGAALDVWSPRITSPDAETVWKAGTLQQVTWDTSNPPKQISNPIGMIVLPKAGVLDSDHPLATDVPLTAGSWSVTVPGVAAGDDYTVVLFGDSGNASPEFSITA
ncbi:hypothetical protein PHLCEN_2v12029 [Hermanssonia centrifuga]|uniref:Yeast cell wall synthesis Kre9/Knh1-like N-terminal domain-containing protein n=1 Tax=Hermanssonia centrifuga TaxID=98765 RepID=A0A2R6NIA4_9APHY|nr:hypothetical protein PHLCEN_2v12029 [Hermanssonia centrifuga]